MMTARARDLVTPCSGPPVPLGEGYFRILTSPRREILEVSTIPDYPGIQGLVGVRAGGASRSRIDELLGDLKGDPLYQLLDDFAGASLVANWIWSRWQPDWAKSVRSSQAVSTAGTRGMMENVCTGFASGASSLNLDGTTNLAIQLSTEVGPLQHPEDPAGWHEMLAQVGPQSRRARRIDLWRDGDLIKVDAAFQDSGATPEGGRIAVHEYRVYSEIEEATGKLVSVQALPLILPYSECPGAAVKVARLVGINVAEFRDSVPAILRSTMGCTHLNDVMRALADVPALAKNLPVERD